MISPNRWPAFPLSARQRQVMEALPVNDPNSVDLQDDDDRWLDWPCCPACAKRRQTFCRTCDLAGDDFPLAEFIPVADPIGAAGSDTAHADGGVTSHGCCGGGSCGSSASPPDSECGDRRHSTVPADDPEPVSDEIVDASLQVLLFCPACSEAFSPNFYRLCAQCGHDFGEGREVRVPRPSEMNNRVLVALSVLGALGVGLLAYFWMLFR